jgi:hypothetical protein
VFSAILSGYESPVDGGKIMKHVGGKLSDNGYDDDNNSNDNNHNNSINTILIYHCRKMKV